MDHSENEMEPHEGKLPLKYGDEAQLCNQADAGTGSWHKPDNAAGAAYCGVSFHLAPSSQGILWW